LIDRQVADVTQRDAENPEPNGDTRAWWYRLLNRQVLILLLLGFSAGLPILLIFSTLSIWLREAGVEKSAVTYFSWAALGYSFKFVWAPLVDKLPLPVVGRWLGRRRSWLLVSQLAVVAAILSMASVDPEHSLQMMAIAAVTLGFASATQDIVIDAYRIECADPDLQALLSSAYITGYRIGMVAAGAGGLFLAAELGSTLDSYSYEAWRFTYYAMAVMMGVGLLTTLFSTEPARSSENPYPYSSSDYLQFLLLFFASVTGFVLVFSWLPEFENNVAGGSGHLLSFINACIRLLAAISAAACIVVLGGRLGIANQSMMKEGYLQPCMNFLDRYGRLALWVLLLIGFYRVSDIVMGVIANVFYQDLGYSKKEIASVTKVFGLVMTIVGSFAGGALAIRYGVLNILLLGAILSAATNLLFVWLAGADAELVNLTVVIAADNFSAGLAVAAFVAWLSGLTSVSFTAVQYAIFSSLMTLFPKLLGGYSGTLVSDFGYPAFFCGTALLGLPVVALILFIRNNPRFAGAVAESD